MSPQLVGVLWAVAAMLAWGGTDFLLQRESRKLGIRKTLFFVSAVACLGLLPFVWNDLPSLFAMSARTLWLLGAAAIAMAVTTLLDTAALQAGKLAVMEPVLSAELPLAAILTAALWNEEIGALGWVLVIVIFIGIVLAATEHHKQLHYHRRVLEKGVAFAAATALCTAFLDLLVGATSQQTASPLLTVWLVWTFGGLVWLGYLAMSKEVRALPEDFRRNAGGILSLGVLNAGAWAAFALATLSIPIAITTAISEGYIVITIFLGLYINRERIRWHQKIGVAVVVAGVLTLAIVTG